MLGQKPSNRVLAFSLGFAAGIMLLISLMEMLPAALAAEGMSPVLGYGMFIVGLLGYFGLDRLLPHAHPQDLVQKTTQPLPGSIKRTAILLTLGISLHNFPEGIATFVTASSNLELGFGIALAVALHNIPEGLAVAGPVYAATGSKRTAIFWAGISGMAEILGGVLAWLILGSLISPVVMAAIMAAVAGIMVALSVDELMPLAKEIDPNNNPSYGVLCGMSVMGLSLVILQSMGNRIIQRADATLQIYSIRSSIAEYEGLIRSLTALLSSPERRKSLFRASSKASLSWRNARQ